MHHLVIFGPLCRDKRREGGRGRAKGQGEGKGKGMEIG